MTQQIEVRTRPSVADKRTPQKEKTQKRAMDNINRKPATLHGLPNAPQNCYQRLLPKAISQSYVPKVVRKTVPESCFRNLFSKGPWSCARAALQSPKAGSQKCSQKNSQSNSSKLLLKILQNKYSLKLFRKAIQSFPKAVPRSCSPKLFPKVVVQNCCPKAAILPRTAPQNHSAKRFPALRKCL